MKIIQICITYALIAGGAHLSAMELSKVNHKTINGSAWDMLTDIAIAKIAACCDSVSRNALRFVSKDLDRLASKKNEYIAFMDPVILGKKDRAHYLIVSCIKGKYDLLCNLLNNNFPHWSKSLYMTLLRLAEQNKHETLVKLLRERCEVELIEGEHMQLEGGTYEQLTFSQLVQAVFCNEADWVEQCLFEGADPNELIPYEGITLLHSAMYNKQVDIINLLFAHPNIQVNFQNIHGDTVLHWAAREGCYYMVESLLKHPDIDVNLGTKYGTIPLMYAICPNKIGILKLLLEHPKIQVNVSDESGRTVLIDAVYFGCCDSVRLLLEQTAIEVNRFDHTGKTALIWAVCCNQVDMVKLLLAHSNIQIDMQNNNGSTALDIAKARSYTGIINLLQSYSDANQQGGLEEDNYSRLIKCVLL